MSNIRHGTPKAQVWEGNSLNIGHFPTLFGEVGIEYWTFSSQAFDAAADGMALPAVQVFAEECLDQLVARIVTENHSAMGGTFDRMEFAGTPHLLVSIPQ